MPETEAISVQSTIDSPLTKVWDCWTDPAHIVNWNFASDDWHCPQAENDARTGGKFRSRMASKDGKMGFDFEGVYDKVIPHTLIEYTLGDDRKVSISFLEQGEKTTVVERFDAEDTNSIEMQRNGWQAIMDNFKTYVEQLS